MISFKEHNESAGVNLEYHINNSIQLNENVFRLGSKAYYDLFNEARKRMKEGTYTPEGVDIVAAAAAIWWFNRDTGLDVDGNGKVDVADAKAAVKKTTKGVKKTAKRAASKVKKK